MVSLGERNMNRWLCILFILACFSQIGCAAILTEKEYILIDESVDVNPIFHGVVYSFQEKMQINKMVFLGSGRINGIDIYVLDVSNQWKLKKKLYAPIFFPREIYLFTETDTIKIKHRNPTDTGRLDTVLFYTFGAKGK